MTPEECQLLFEYDAWANARACDACAALTTEQFTREIASSFPSLRDTLVHIFGAQWIWLERFHGRTPPGLPSAGGFSDLASVRERWSEVQRELSAFVAGLSAHELASNFEYHNLKGEVFLNPRWQALQHLANHGTYHRGQITTLLRQLGAKPVNTDLIGFYRQRAKH